MKCPECSNELRIREVFAEDDHSFDEEDDCCYEPLADFVCDECAEIYEWIDGSMGIWEYVREKPTMTNNVCCAVCGHTFNTFDPDGQGVIICPECGRIT